MAVQNNTVNHLRLNVSFEKNNEFANGRTTEMPSTQDAWTSTGSITIKKQRLIFYPITNKDEGMTHNIMFTNIVPDPMKKIISSPMIQN